MWYIHGVQGKPSIRVITPPLPVVFSATGHGVVCCAGSVGTLENWVVLYYIINTLISVPLALGRVEKNKALMHSTAEASMKRACN